MQEWEELTNHAWKFSSSILSLAKIKISMNMCFLGIRILRIQCTSVS